MDKIHFKLFIMPDMFHEIHFQERSGVGLVNSQQGYYRERMNGNS